MKKIVLLSLSLLLVACKQTASDTSNNGKNEGESQASSTSNGYDISIPDEAICIDTYWLEIRHRDGKKMGENHNFDFEPLRHETIKNASELGIVTLEERKNEMDEMAFFTTIEPKFEKLLSSDSAKFCYAKKVFVKAENFSEPEVSSYGGTEYEIVTADVTFKIEAIDENSEAISKVIETVLVPEDRFSPNKIVGKTFTENIGLLKNSEGKWGLGN